MRSDNLVGLKHASTDLAYLTELLIRLGPEFRAFVRQEDLSFPMLAIGAADLPAARALHFELFEINQAVFYDTNPIPMKFMMKYLGMHDSNEHRLPLVSASTEPQRRRGSVGRSCRDGGGGRTCLA